MTVSRRMFLRDAGLAGIGLSFTGAWQAARAASLRARSTSTPGTPISAKTPSPISPRAAGAGVNISLFANNDELFAKLRGGNQGYDVIVPSNDFVERMPRPTADPLDHAKIPNQEHRPAFLDAPFDPGRRVSVPYTWIVTGIGYRKSKVRACPTAGNGCSILIATRAASPCWARRASCSRSARSIWATRPTPAIRR
jgi:spermidine/putrescine transport system substrate-binding protein